MAENKGWRDYLKSVSTEKETDSKETGTWRDLLSGKATESEQTSGGWRDKLKSATTRVVANEVSNRVNSWLQNYNGYISDYQKRNSGRKYSYEDSYVSDSGEWLEKAKKQKSAYDTEADEILSYIDQYKGYLDTDWVKEIKSTLTGARSNQNKILEAYAKDNEWWSSFGDEELVKEYGSAEDAYKYYQMDDNLRKTYTGMSSNDISAILETLEDGKEKDWLTDYKSTVVYDERSKADLDAMAKEIEDMENLYNEAFTVGFWHNEYEAGLTPYDRKRMETYNRLHDEYGGDIHNLEKAISQKKQEMTLAGRVQEGIKLSGVADETSEFYDPEFASKTGYVSTKSDKWNSRLTTPFGMGYEDLTYEYINGSDNGLRDEILNKVIMNDYDPDDYYIYDHMTDSQRDLYNYYYKEGGKESAERYLDSIQDALTYQEAKERFEKKKGKTGLELLYGIGAGVDQFQSGFKNFFNTEDAYIPASTTQVVSGMIREDLGENSGAFAKGAYDFINTTANMLPSILVSTAIGAINPTAGAVAGNALMGASAAGNAYSDAINRGFGKSEARTYSTLIGVSEVALGAALGGISKLGGVSSKLAKAVAGIDSGLARFALQYGGKIASESLEEGLQEILDPLFQNAILHADEDVDWGEVAYSALLGGLSAGALESIGTVKQVGTEQRLKKAYDGKTDSIINEGLASDIDTESYQLATEYKEKTASGKTLTGAEIRNLLEANQEQITPKDLKLIKRATEKRLTELGETGNVAQIAELATKRATGQKLSKAETSILAHSQYGAQVAKELLPENIEANNAAKEWAKANNGEEVDDFSNWAENIGTRKVNFEAYNKDKIKAREALNEMVRKATEDPNAYKSLDSRVEAEKDVQVSDTGKSVIRGTDQEIDLSNPTFKKISENGAVLIADGKAVDANNIDYADADLGYAIKAVGKIENITPAAAGAVVGLVDKAKPVVAQMNGLDEAFNYGFYNYSEADLKAGNFTGNLSQVQLNDAYKLGQYVRSQTDMDADAPVVKMRTAAEAKLTEEQKLAQQKAQIESDDVEVYFEDGGKTVKFDEHSGKYDKKRKAAVNTAKFLAKLKIGSKYYFFKSYVNEAGDRVYKDANGKEKAAPNGIYMENDGSIHIDLNAGDDGSGIALFTLGHELAHFVKAQSKKQFKILADLVTEAFDKTDLSMHERVLAKQEFLDAVRREKALKGEYYKKVSYDEAYEEVVADAMSTMLTDGTFHEKLMEIRVKDKGLFNTIKRFFNKMIAKFRKEYEKLTPDQKDAQDIRAMKDMFDKIQTAFAEALVEASDNFQAAMESVVEADAKPMPTDQIVTDGAVVTDGNGDRHSIRSMKHDIAEGKMFEDLKNVCGWTDAQVNTLRKQLNDLVEYMIPYRNILDMNETYGMEGRRFSPYKPNSDPLYKISMDFSTLCSKRLLTQYVIENLQLRENRPMSAEEQMAIRAMLNEYRKVEKGLQVACAMCYVEAARLKSPKQIQRWLDDPTPHLINYFAQKNTEFNNSVKEAQADFKESKGYDRNAPKKDMKPADVKELNKIGPKLRSQYQLSAEEQAIVEKAKTLPNSTYLTAGNLANLSETDPVIYAAYTSFVRTATRSKSLETDEPYYYGDSTRDNGNGIVVTDSFIEAVNRENGMRFSSWSDWRIQHLLDYITAVIDNSVRGAAMHGYTKFGDEVRVLGKTGMMFNMSGVTGTQTGLNEDGSLNFSDTESIDVNEAIQLREEFPETAGLQCIGVSNDHIIALLASDIIDYVIPYHVSGLNAALRRMADIHGWADYTGTQNASIDKSIKLEDAADKEHWHEEPVFSEFFVGYDTGMSGIEAMRESAKRYVQMCKDRGLTPKFNQFANEENYWKLLIDRKMINQQTGNLIQQKAVTPTFDFDTIKGVVDKFVDNYDAGLEARALNHIVENWDSIPQHIKDLKKGGTKTKKAAKAADTLSNQTIAAQPKYGVKNSDRGGNQVSTQTDHVRFSQRSFNKTVDNIVYSDDNAPFDFRSVFMGETPQTLLDLGFIQLPMTITSKHIYTIANKEGRFSSPNDNYHDLGATTVKELPEMLKESVVTFVEKENPRRVIIVTSKVDSSGQPIMVAVEYSGQTRYQTPTNEVQIYANPVTTALGKKDSWFVSQIEEAVRDGRMLQADKKRSQEAPSGVWAQCPESLWSSDFTVNIEQFRQNVKRFLPKEKQIRKSWNAVRESEETTKKSERASNKELAGMDDTALYIKNTDKANYIGMIFNGAKTEETRSRRTLDAFIGNDFYVTDGKYVYGSIVLGEPHQYTEAEFHQKKNQLKHRVPVGDEYDIKPGGTKWAYPIESYKKFDEPKKLSESTEYKNSFQARQVRYSERGEGSSNRALLANAFEGISQNSVEYKMLQDYKGQIKKLNELDARLSELNAEIREIRFTKGKYDAKRLKELETEAEETANEINKHDKLLVNMEASEPLRKVIERERKKENQKVREHINEIQQNKKMRAEQTELRHKIRKTVRDLDKLLNRGNKKLNVKEDMKGFASKALELADYLFTDHISNDELIRNGITVRMTPKEAALVKETEDILTKLYDQADSLTDEEFKRLDEKRKANEYKLRDLLTAQRNERLNTPVYNLFNDLVTEYAKLKNSGQEAVKAAYNADVERFLRSYIGEANGETDSGRKTLLQNMRVADMTTDELWKLSNAYEMVLYSIRQANTLFVKGKAETLEQKVGRIAKDFESRKIPEGKVATIARNLSNKMGWDYEKLYYALERIGSEAFAELVMNIADSENTVMQDVMEAAAFRDEMVKKYDYNNWNVNKEIDREFLDSTGKKFKLTLGQLMALYAYSRRDGAWDHIEYGGFVFGEAALTNPRPADSYKLSKDQCTAITDLLTKEQKGYAEDMQKFLSETMGEKGNEVSMLLYGIKMFGEKNYFPIHIAGQFKAQAQESQAKAAAGFSSMTNAGFTHAQNPNAKAPFVLEGFNEIWVDHVNEMSRYHGTVPALEDMRRVMNYSHYSEATAESIALKQMMENSFGKDAVDYFDNLYREANSGAITDKLQKWPKKLLSLFRKNSVAYSLSVLVQQPASLVRAYALVDRKYFGFKGVGALTSGIAKAVSSKWNPAYANAYNEMLKYAPGVTMAKEIGGFDTATGGSIRSYLLDTNKSLKQTLKTGNAKEVIGGLANVVDDNAIANLPNVADKIAWIEIWNACKRETVAKHKDLATNSEEFMKLVGERFTEVIRATQVYDSIFAKSPLLKSKNLAVQYLVSFMNEPNTVANMVEKAVRDTANGNWKSGVRTAVVVMHSIIFTNVLKSIVYAMRDDDEDETYIEKYLEAIAGNMTSDFNPLNYIPIARDVWSLAQGYDVERADMAIVADAIDALGKVVKNAFTETDDMTEEQLIAFDKKVTDANWKLVESMASFFGIPVKNIRREIEGVLNTAKNTAANHGLTTKKSARDKVYDSVVDSIPFMSSKAKNKQDKLYDVIVSGDKAYLERLKATYKDEDAYHTAVRKALRENDPRIREAAQAQINGNPSERVRIAKLIIADGFIQDDVVMAINAEINAMTSDNSSPSAKKAKGFYTVEDFITEAVNGDRTAANAIKDDVLQTAQKNGKTLEEAEKDFISNVKSNTKKAYLDGSLNDAVAEKILLEYTDMDDEEVAAKVSYWDFSKANPDYDLNESQVNKFHEFAEPAEIPLDVFVQYVEGTNGLETKYDEWGDVEVSKREQVLAVIDSLDLTWQQKDALYLAHGYAESEIWDVPW